MPNVTARMKIMHVPAKLLTCIPRATEVVPLSPALARQRIPKGTWAPVVWLPVRLTLGVDCPAGDVAIRLPFTDDEQKAIDAFASFIVADMTRHPQRT